MNKQFEDMNRQMQPSAETENKLYARLNAESEGRKRRYLTWKAGGTAALVCAAAALVIAVIPKAPTTEITVGGNDGGGTTNQSAIADIGHGEGLDEIDGSEIGDYPIYYELRSYGDWADYEKNSYNDAYLNTEEEKLSEKIGTADFYVWSEDGSVEKNMVSEVYAIKGISFKCAVAVKADIDGQPIYRVFTNSLYTPETLGEFVNDLNLKETIGISTFYVETGTSVSEYKIGNISGFFDLIFSTESSENLGEEHYSGIQDVDISVDIADLNIKNVCLGISADGYIRTNILATAKSFFIGEENAKKAIKLLMDNSVLVSTENYVGGNEDTSVGSPDDAITTQMAVTDLDIMALPGAYGDASVGYGVDGDVPVPGFGVSEETETDDKDIAGEDDSTSSGTCSSQ